MGVSEATSPPVPTGTKGGLHPKGLSLLYAAPGTNNVLSFTISKVLRQI